jgi:hypothetical protein
MPCAASLPSGARTIRQSDAPLTVEELEAGLELLDRMDVDEKKFWNEKGRAFRATVRLAIRETAEALLLQQMPHALRIELEDQLAWLTNYLRPQDRH